MELFSDEMRRDPYPFYAELRAHSPVFHDSKSGLWLLFAYEDVKLALTDHESFSSRHGPATWLLFLDPPRHTQLRALIAQAFTPRSVVNLEPRVRALSAELLDPAVEHGKIDLVLDYAIPLPMLVIAEMLGIPFADRPQFTRWSDVIVNMSYTVLSGKSEASQAAAAAFVAATQEMDSYLDGILHERRSKPRDDLLSRLALSEIDGERLSQADILGFFQLLLVGGQETTTNLIANAVLSLMEHPDQLAKLRTSPELIPSAVEEVLRYRSPLQWMFRVTTCDVTIRDQIIPAGKVVLVMMGSANRDPAFFPDPHCFNMSRSPNAHLAFGHGIHFCLGAPLARMEGRIALGDLLSRMENLELAGEKSWTPREGLHVLGPASLPVRFRASLSPPKLTQISARPAL
jgi:cytochrome P450